MEIKLLEIRDRMTFIPAMAVRFKGADHPLLRAAGYGDRPYVVLTMLERGESQNDPFNWGPARTMREAHVYVESNWFDLEDGGVLDVEFVLGETPEPKRSQL